MFATRKFSTGRLNAPHIGMALFSTPITCYFYIKIPTHLKLDFYI